jgi:ActR/RegA family two-component response regulator
MTAERRVLIVDDEPVLRRMLGTYLSRAGWTCLLAETPSEALGHLSAGPLSHAVVDLHLGPHSGHDLIRVLAERRSDLRIVAITGSVAAGLPAGTGAAVVLSKPITPLSRMLDALEGRPPNASAAS